MLLVWQYQKCPTTTLKHDTTKPGDTDHGHHTMNNIALVLLAVLSSSVITTAITQFSKRGTTRAEEKNILMSGSEKSLAMMMDALDYQAMQISELRTRVGALELTLAAYHHLHGPLPDGSN
jgi:hypothetical protein